MTEPAKGLIALVAANVIWGLSPIFYKALDHVPPPELLAHRTVWSLVFFGALLALQGRLQELARAGRGPGAAWKLVASAGLISINWGLFIWAVQVGRTVETSLGYYILPIIAVALGMVVFRERAEPAKLVAFACAVLAVTVLTYGLGVVPWVPLILAVSFAIYAMIKRVTATGPVVSVTAEVVILTPFALGWLAFVHGQGDGAFGTAAWDTALLVASGPVTAVPLFLFSYASRRIGFGTLGLAQYINPTLQFLVAWLLFVEPVTIWHAVALPLIWFGLGVYSWAALSRERAARKPSVSAPTL